MLALGAMNSSSIQERMVSHGRLLISTPIPSTAACADGGHGWVMEVRVFTGSRAAAPDSTSDNLLSCADALDGAAPAGVQVGAAQAAAAIVRHPAPPSGAPAVPCVASERINTSEGRIVRVGGSCSRVPSRRASWEQLQ